MWLFEVPSPLGGMETLHLCFEHLPSQITVPSPLGGMETIADTSIPPASIKVPSPLGGMETMKVILAGLGGK